MRYSRKNSSRVTKKQELIKYLVHTNSLSAEQISGVLDSIVNFIKASLIEGSDINFLNLFTIQKVHCKPKNYNYTHLKTGEQIKGATNPTWKLRFNLSKNMERFLENNYDDIR